ncbi:MAG: phosphatase PAP2 family protein [Patescibacteria group bacterium]|jgi:undecaprenyl-diphosphatase
MSELAIVSSLQQSIIGSPLLISSAVFAARWLILAFLPLAVFCLVQGKTGRHAVSEAVWALVIALLLTSLLSRIIERPRPFLAEKDTAAPVMNLVPPPYNTSFPSGHTASVAAMAAALAYVHRRVGFAAVLVAAAVALGRVLVGVHYPTDLIGGLVVGLLAFAIVRFCHNELRKRV